MWKDNPWLQKRKHRSSAASPYFAFGGVARASPSGARDAAAVRRTSWVTWLSANQMAESTRWLARLQVSAEPRLDCAGRVSRLSSPFRDSVREQVRAQTYVAAAAAAFWRMGDINGDCPCSSPVQRGGAGDKSYQGARTGTVVEALLVEPYHAGIVDFSLIIWIA